MRTLGIDLAASPDKTAACTIDWATGEVVLLPRPTDDDALVSAIATADMTGIDVPLGWPDAFVDAMVAHRDGAPWPPMADVPPTDREPLRFRHTDRHTQQTGARPLSVSTDRIGVAAMRGARLQQLARDRGVVVDRSGLTGQVLEAYPAAALRAWGLTSSGYKRPPNVAALRLLVHAFTERCGSLAPRLATLLADADDDDLDAVICAVIARAALLGMTTGPGDEHVAAARREGWIHVPTAPIEQIVA